MAKTITGILIDTTKPKTEIGKYELKQTTKPNLNLQRIYDMLHCDCIDVVERKFGKHYYDIYCDDEGTFKENNPVSIATFDKQTLVEQIVGTVFICKHDGEGGMQSLTPQECQEVLEIILAYTDHEGNERVCLGASL